jgi:hypothetical protein
MWQRYLDWIDRDLGDGWPSMNGWSSLMPLIPVTFALILGFFVHPNEKPGMTELILVVVPMFALFSVWGWRVYLAAMRQVRAIKSGSSDDQ